MVVRCLYIARGKNNVIFMQKCLILKVVKYLKGFKNYMINTCFKRSLTEKKKCENQYFLIKLLLKIKNQGGGGADARAFFLYLFSVFC